MNYRNLVLSVVVLLASAVQIARADLPQLPPIVVQPMQPIPGHPILHPPVYSCGIDPAVTRINYQLIQRTAPFRGIVRVTATVKNVGNRAFVSRAGQQAVLLYSDRTMVARRAFVNLAVGQSFTITYDRAWDASSPAEGEFPPMFRAVLTYDPDIYIDSNPQNDDCSNRNNDLLRSGSAINALFH